jgi:hypothetical protein
MTMGPTGTGNTLLARCPRSLRTATSHSRGFLLSLRPMGISTQTNTQSVVFESTSLKPSATKTLLSVNSHKDAVSFCFVDEAMATNQPALQPSRRRHKRIRAPLTIQGTPNGDQRSGYILQIRPRPIVSASEVC